MILVERWVKLTRRSPSPFHDLNSPLLAAKSVMWNTLIRSLSSTGCHCFSKRFHLLIAATAPPTVSIRKLASALPLASKNAVNIIIRLRSKYLLNHSVRATCSVWVQRRPEHGSWPAEAFVAPWIYMKLLCCAALAAATLSAQTFSGAPALDQAIDDAIAHGRLPGAVLLVGHDGHVVYRQAYGLRAEVPRREAMTLDTVFDLASLTKVIATTSSLMKLFEQGKFRLNDRVTDYIPEFQNGKSDVTIRNLFTHFSGLQPDVPLKDPWTGYETGIHLACTDKPTGPPGVRHVYSD